MNKSLKSVIRESLNSFKMNGNKIINDTLKKVNVINGLVDNKLYKIKDKLSSIIDKKY